MNIEDIEYQNKLAEDIKATETCPDTLDDEIKQLRLALTTLQIMAPGFVLEAAYKSSGGDWATFLHLLPPGYEVGLKVPGWPHRLITVQ